MPATPASQFEEAVYRKAARRLIPFLFLCYILAFMDRVNVGFAKLQMADDLQLSDAVYGFGAGIFFISYFIFEVPSNMILEKLGARIWIARIMITWGLIASAFMFTGDMRWGPIAAMFSCTDAQFTFYFLRFWLGVAEAGFFPGVILYLTYWFPGPRRAKMIALFMSAIGVAQLAGSPLSGGIMQFMDGVNSWHGWQWLFLLEGLPTIAVGVLVLAILPNGPRTATWLTAQERDLLMRRIDEDNAGKQYLVGRRSFSDVFRDGSVWALSLVYFAQATCLYVAGFWMPTIIQELGIDKQDYFKVGLLSMIPWGASVLTMIYWSDHSDRTGERRWHCASGFLVMMAGLLLLAFAQGSPVLSIIALTLLTTGWAGCVCIFWSLPTAFLSGTAAAAGIAWINSVGNLGGYFGPDLVGTIRTAAGGKTAVAFFALAALALLGALVVLFLPRTQRTSVATKMAAQRLE
ncbi:MAG: MFS transporter [Pseudomonadota bacterium]